jgi:hypothetical protein
MEELSLIEFLKLEVHLFRELLSSFVAETIAYEEACYEKLIPISLVQKQLLDELKTKRPQRFTPFDLNNSVEASLASSLKEQLDLLIIKLHSQKEKNLYLRQCPPIHLQTVVNKKQLMTETLEDEC